jgi:hypothetical protein
MDELLYSMLPGSPTPTKPTRSLLSEISLNQTDLYPQPLTNSSTHSFAENCKKTCNYEYLNNLYQLYQL